MSVHHKAASTNTYLIAAMTQAGAVIHYLTIRGVSVKSVILHNCKSVIRIEHALLNKSEIFDDFLPIRAIVT
ncbi:hypothetical protein [Candidatus Sodalis pierantonius]|uniref:hypothetical protein n=1 Tax=Candidatus Sodalis pierantonii TaxID=1486991 RepID=UPI00046D0DBE|nr:hypothetical protein [Candidatus Sodalis pierantonius]